MDHYHKAIIDDVIEWFEESVLGLNLCPFAAQPYRQNAIRFELSLARDDESCLTDLLLGLRQLEQQQNIETLLLIIPDYLQEFADYNQFLNLADGLLEQQGWEGVFQIASFHPKYVFAGSDSADKANWTNRSPYPLLHLIRESSVSKAISKYPDIEQIPDRNIELLRSMNDIQIQNIFKKIND